MNDVLTPMNAFPQLPQSVISSDSYTNKGGLGINTMPVFRAHRKPVNGMQSQAIIDNVIVYAEDTSGVVRT